MAKVRLPVTLPIDPHLEGIATTLSKERSLVLRATPGSGKTTRVPPTLLKSEWRGDGEILVLEPRRLAAKWAARRVADELHAQVGGLVGYQFRFENQTSAETRLRFLTEGMLMRRLLSDRELKRVSCVILDEFHERHLHGDLALAWLRALQKGARPDLRIVVMSATLETETLAEFLGDPGKPCPIVTVETRVHPIEVSYLPGPVAKTLERTVKDGVDAELAKTDGDLLVFLPGMGEIRRCEAELRALGSRFDILPLHGELTREEQDRAILPSDRRKVILATNVAETSLTIEGVTSVIDSGLHRIASYSWWSGMPALRTRPISRAAAIQRAGRAGRTGPGRCLRLYPKGDFEGRAPFEVPEIQRADLAQTYLELKSLGVEDPASFKWFEAPSSQSLEAARKLLYLLGALDSEAPGASLTAIGKRMATVPAHPRLARMLIEGEAQGCLEEAARLGAMISESRLERVDALEALATASRTRDEGLARAERQLLSALKPEHGARNSSPKGLAYAALAGFPDRVARRRTPTEILLASGGSARLDEGEAHGEWFVTLDIQETQAHGQTRSQLRARSVIGIDPNWLLDLEPSQVADVEELSWESGPRRVVARQQLRYGSLVIDESAVSTGDSIRDTQGASRVLLKAGLGLDPSKLQSMSHAEWIAALASVAQADVLENALARASLLARHRPELGLQDPLAAPAHEVFLPALQGKLTLAALEELDWAAEILSRAREAEPRLETLIPTHTQLACGRKIKINYPLAQAPWIESRLQDFMGMKEGPSILGGRLKLLLHLLAPNQRAVQVTQDLAGFWTREYPSLRKELGRRYPRHDWPEDPLSQVGDRRSKFTPR